MTKNDFSEEVFKTAPLFPVQDLKFNECPQFSLSGMYPSRNTSVVFGLLWSIRDVFQLSRKAGIFQLCDIRAFLGTASESIK